VWGLATIYLAYRFREFRKFLAGAFFVSWGIQLYLYFANVSVPLLGTDLVFTPESYWLASWPTPPPPRPHSRFTCTPMPGSGWPATRCCSTAWQPGTSAYRRRRSTSSPWDTT